MQKPHVGGHIVPYYPDNEDLQLQLHNIEEYTGKPVRKRRAERRQKYPQPGLDAFNTPARGGKLGDDHNVFSPQL